MTNKRFKALLFSLLISIAISASQELIAADHTQGKRFKDRLALLLCSCFYTGEKQTNRNSESPEDRILVYFIPPIAPESPHATPLVPELETELTVIRPLPPSVYGYLPNSVNQSPPGPAKIKGVEEEKDAFHALDQG